MCGIKQSIFVCLARETSCCAVKYEAGLAREAERLSAFAMAFFSQNHPTFGTGKNVGIGTCLPATHQNKE